MMRLEWNIDDAKKAWQDEAREEERNDIILRLLRDKQPVDLIARAANFPIDKITAIARANGLTVG